MALVVHQAISVVEKQIVYMQQVFVAYVDELDPSQIMIIHQQKWGMNEYYSL